jgi:lipopolysaccharide biosynthesis glycosyltransferase
MNIVYASDNNFAEIMGVSMLSLFENNKDVDEINVYVFDSAIEKENRMKLESLARQYHRHLFFVSTKNIVTKLNCIKQDRGGASQFARLFLSKLLPEFCEKVLYIDCDTIIRHSLQNFYCTDFEGFVICGVMDCISKQHRARLGLRDDSLYINSGMLLVDMRAWRERCVDDSVEAVINQFNGRVPYADQGIINLALQGKIKSVHPRYNCISVYTAFSFNDLLEYRQPSACLSSAEIEDAKKDPTIAHFVTLFCLSRPWFQGARGTFFEEWKLYKRMSPWKDAPERPVKKNVFHKFAAGLYKYAPRSVSLTLLGFLHARIKPIVMGYKPF